MTQQVNIGTFGIKMDVVHTQFLWGYPKGEENMEIYIFFYVVSLLFADAVKNNCLTFTLACGDHPYAILTISLAGAKFTTEDDSLFFPPNMKVEEMKDEILVKLSEYLKWHKEVSFELETLSDGAKFSLSKSALYLYGNFFFSDTDLSAIWKDRFSCKETGIAEGEESETL